MLSASGHRRSGDGYPVAVLRQPPLPALTSVRFFAALIVVLFHFGGPSLGWAPEALRHIVGAGYTGVSLFFVLSGFILAYVYHGRSVHNGRFWWARFARVYPLFVFALLIAFPGFLRGFLAGDFPAQTPLLSPLLLHAWDPRSACAWNCPGWSLSVEAFFYLTFPFLLVLLRDRARRSLIAVALGAWLVMLLPPLAYVFTQVGGASATPETPSVILEVLKYNPLLHLPEFVLGVASGILFVRGVRLPRPGVTPWV